MLLRCGADINAQDYDGWTPLHAAGYWAQPEACQVLVENLCNMDIKNHQVSCTRCAAEQCCALLVRGGVVVVGGEEGGGLSAVTACVRCMYRGWIVRSEGGHFSTASLSMDYFSPVSSQGKLFTISCPWNDIFTVIICSVSFCCDYFFGGGALTSPCSYTSVEVGFPGDLSW